MNFKPLSLKNWQTLSEVLGE